MIQYVIVGTHEYEWCLWPLGKLFAKYWGPQTLTYIGDRQVGDLPDNITFMHVPCYSEGVWPWAHWFGNGLNSIMSYYEGWLVCLFLPDHWITEPVYHRSVDILSHYMACHDDVIRGHFTAGTAFYNYGKKREEWHGLDIWELSPKHPDASLDAGLTFSPSLWNTRQTRRVIKPDWSLWQCEELGSYRLYEDFNDIRVVAAHPPAVFRTHGLSHHHKNVNLTALRAEDREIVRAYIPEGWGVIE